MARKISVLERRRIVDALLRDTSRLYDKYELAEAVQNRARFLGYDDICGLSTRTIDLDIKKFKDSGMVLCDDKGGKKNKALRYKNPSQPNPTFAYMNDCDMDILQRAINLIESMGDEPQFRWAKMFLSAISTKERNDIDQPYVDFHVAKLEGIDHFDRLFSVCVRHQPIELEYTPFDAPIEHHVISPYQLRHFNDRWYLIGFSHNGQRDHFAFDRISDVLEVDGVKYRPASKRFLSIYNDMFGVSHKLDDKPEHIDLLVARRRYDYMRTKKIHCSQFDTTNNYDKSDRVHVKLNMVINKELIAHLLSFGSDVEVMAPDSLRDMLKGEVKKMSENYF